MLVGQRAARGLVSDIKQMSLSLKLPSSAWRGRDSANPTFLLSPSSLLDPSTWAGDRERKAGDGDKCTFCPKVVPAPGAMALLPISLWHLCKMCHSQALRLAGQPLLRVPLLLVPLAPEVEAAYRNSLCLSGPSLLFQTHPTISYPGFPVKPWVAVLFLTDLPAQGLHSAFASGL